MKLKSATLATFSCSDIYHMFSVAENGTDTGAVYRRKGCSISGSEIRLNLYWRTTLVGGTGRYMEVQLNKQFTGATVINAYGVMTITTVDPATNTDLQNQTNELINNNNSNTQIITNAVDNSATNIINQMQDNLNFCSFKEIDKNTEVIVENKFLNTSGIATTNNGFGITDYIKIKANDKIYLSTNMSNSASYCIYNDSKTLVECIQYQSQNNAEYTPQQDGYLRATIPYGISWASLLLKIKICQDRTQAEVEAIDVLRNTIMHQGEWEEEDDEVKNGLLRNIISGIGNIFGFLGDDELDNPDDALGDLSSNMGTNNVISSLLLLPVSIYQSVVNNINGTCNSFNLGSLYNHNLTMTCIRPQDYLGSALWGVIDVIISGIFVLHIRKKFVDIFNHFTSLRTGEMN